MPRKLPWQVDDNSSKSATPTPAPSNSSIKKHSEPKQLAARGSNSNVSTPARSPRDAVRTPSTSPPCEAPPEELMKEGLENDDKYIMVEDEFLATAQTFTHHLHHAEYVRRKNEAKIKNANAIKDLARPTGLKSALSVEGRKNMEADENSARQKAALEKFKNVAGRPLVDSEVEDEGIDSEEDRDDDPWVGTSLQNLMTNQRKHQSLVGLQGIKSTSRAALGFSKASTDLPPEGQPENHDERSGSSRAAVTDAHVIDDETTTGEDDDLDAQPRQPKTVQRTQQPKPTVSRTTAYASVSRPTDAETKTTWYPPEKVNVSHKPAVSVSSNSRHAPFPPSRPRSRMMSFLDDLDDDDDYPAPIKREYEDKSGKDQIRKRSPSESTSNKRQDKNSNSKKSHLNEVPTFLL
ncbi:hypothetical protein AJ79_05207 [Helicocarpus griseus UAMH5409]|uniref:Uncharacterized protein n=1 Tax=Helicocarpus griseus UAMH5409 TaxID=1447875 RepID=A0A2B7XQR7_9EURO|nr:hypothetical protein AJ79_05207 [Helicocarpus griseus UAMH5409]